MEALVILEAGTALPGFVDALGGAESNVYVLCEREHERLYAFENRVVRLVELLDVQLGVLVCGDACGRDRTAVRASLLIALKEATAGRSGSVMLAETRPGAEREELARLHGARLMRVHEPAPARREEPVARRRVA